MRAVAFPEEWNTCTASNNAMAPGNLYVNSRSAPATINVEAPGESITIIVKLGVDSMSGASLWKL